MKRINWSMYVLLILACQVIIGDSLIYFLKSGYILTNIIAIILNIIINFVLIKKRIIKIESNFCKWDIVGIIVILCFIISSILIPDESWDTFSYHIYLQQNPFADKINFDYLPGRTFTSYVFPLADRINYLFRFSLGYRLGTIFGYFLLIIIFYQTKSIFKAFLKEKIEDKYISLLSILPLFTFAIIEQLGSYYIDNYSAVFLIEIFYITIFESKDIIKSKPKLYYVFLLAGLIISIKIANLAYIIIPFIVILIKNLKDIKDIKWYEYLLLICIFLLPILPYMVYNIIETGSPIYPYYNKIFKSKYFSEENWLDRRFGPQTIIQTLLWPVYICINPRKFYEFPTVDAMWYLGYIVIIISLCKKIFERIFRKTEMDKNEVYYIVILLFTYLAWAKFLLGYQRYGIAIPILSEIYVIKIFIASIENKKVIKILVFSFMIAFSIYKAFNFDMIQDNNLIKNIKNKDVEGAKSIIRNVKYIFKDRTNEKFDIDGIWGVIYDNSAIPTLINVNDRLMHLETGGKTTPNELTEKKYWDYVNNNDIYIPIDKHRLDPTIQFLDDFDFKIQKIEKILNNVTFLDDNNCIYILKVSYELGTENNMEIFQKLLKENNE